jgi:hypothetical protein
VAPWRQLRHGLARLLGRTAADREIDEEVRHYLEEAAAAHEARGLSAEEARRAARRELGNPLAVREEVRAYGWENALETLFADLRYAARRLRSEPGFTVVAVLTLALGIGATTAIVSAVRPILFEPLPYPHPGRVATIREVRADGGYNDGTFGMYRELAARSRSFESIAVLRPWQPTLTGADRPERLEGQRVSASWFDVLGVKPPLGRGFRPDEDQRGTDGVVVLSDGLWRRRFGADPAVVGRAVTLDETPYVVVGVMPAGFENVLAPAAELWAPLQYDMTIGAAWGHHLRTVGRLRPGVEAEGAARELDALGASVLAELHPETYGAEVAFDVVPLRDDVTRGVRPALLAILGAVLLVLAIACGNVINLLLARGVHRRGELALRAALGAPRGRLVRQLLTESLLLAGLGGLVGMVLAVAGVRALVALAPPELPRLGAIGVDGATFGLGLAITTLIGLAFGTVPALRAAGEASHRGQARISHEPSAATSHLPVSPVLRSVGLLDVLSSTPASPSRRAPWIYRHLRRFATKAREKPGLPEASARVAGGHRRLRGALVVAEVALALVVLVSSGLLFRSAGRLLAVAPGFEPASLLTMQVQVSGRRFDDDATMRRFFEQALEAARGVPGVEAAALTSQLPLSGDLDVYGAAFDPSRAEDQAEDPSVLRYAVSPGYFAAMGIPVLRGRALGEPDREGAPRAAVISESVARRRLPGLDPLGRRLYVGPREGEPYTVVGVVGDVRQESLASEEASAVYTTEAQWHFADRAMSLVVRGRGGSDVAALAPAVREAVWSVDADQPVVRVATMEALVAASAAERHFVLILFEAFALAALALAAAGLYGVLSGSVAERTREIGVRAALGASRRDVLALVLRQGAWLTGLGVAVGAAGAVAAGQAIAAMLFGVSPRDPATYVGVVALLAAVAALACVVPAWRAARVDPASTLRTE